MQTWLWVIALFVFGTLMYLVGYRTGKADAAQDKAPNPECWIRAKEIIASTNKEIAFHEINAKHEEEMRLIERGIYDNLGPDGEPNQALEGDKKHDG